MKQIQPVTIWSNGVNYQANYLKAASVYDDFATSAKFYYQLFNCTTVDGVDNCTEVVSGNLTVEGTDYENWGNSGNINEDAYTICANKLSLILL